MLCVVVSFAIIPNIIQAKVVIDSKSPPVITAINDSYVYVDYKKSFKNLNSSRITKLELYQQWPGKNTPHYLGRASHEIESVLLVYKTLEQPLGNQLMAKMDPCKGIIGTKKDLHLKLTYYDDAEAEGMLDYNFKYHPSLYWKKYSNNFLCSEGKKSIRLNNSNSDIFQVSSCIDTIKVAQGNRFMNLSEGLNKIDDFSKKEKIWISINAHTAIDERQLIPCDIGDIIKDNIDKWICLAESGILNVIKTEWDNFQIRNPKFENEEELQLRSSVMVDVNLTLKYDDISRAVLYRVPVQPCSASEEFESMKLNKDRNSTALENIDSLYIVSASVGSALVVILIVMLILIFYVKRRRDQKNISNNRISTDQNPNYGCNYDENYMESQIVEDNEHYDNEESEEEQTDQDITEVNQENDTYECV